MTRDDEAGALVAARYFLTDLYPYAVQNQDVATWDRYSAPICKSCASIRSSIVAEKNAEQFTVPGRILVLEEHLAAVDPVRFQVQFTAQQNADLTYSAQGDVIGGRPSRRLRLVFLVVREPERWLIGGVDVLATSGDAP